MTPDNDNQEDRLALIAGLMARVRRKNGLPRLVIVIVIMLALGLVGIIGWRFTPITAQQVTHLRGLVHLAADRRTESTQAIYARLRRTVGVRRMEDMRRADYERAVEVLTREAQ